MSAEKSQTLVVYVKYVTKPGILSGFGIRGWGGMWAYIYIAYNHMLKTNIYDTYFRVIKNSGLRYYPVFCNE
jgi:hypothetical protein